MVAFLCWNRHNFSDFLDREPQGISPWQVRRAEEFIAANWNQPITVEELAKAVGASVRTIFRCFKQSRGFGPMVFVKQLRLDHARQLLNRGDAGTTVTGTALSCGFHNLSHFAVDYRRAFGERPSETLNRAMGKNFVAECKASRAPGSTRTSQ
ncbi:MAG: helix-turn-helix domain-containing protein [Xanthobacteraceae bacterium]